MEKFEASSGVRVLTLEGGLGFQHPDQNVSTNGINHDKVDALREFFQAERDEELGRWRWSGNPDHVVYPTQGYTDEVTVVDERAAEEYTVTRDRAAGNGWAKPAARAYFEAHPEPKPWEDAKDGHLWLIRFDDYPETDVSALVKGGRFIYNDHCHEGVAELADPTITAARRIWPPESD